MKANPLPFITSSDKEVSLWQSAVTQVVHRKLLETKPGIKRNSREVNLHPMVLATNLHVRAMNRNEKIGKPELADFAGKSQDEIHKDHHLHSYLSQEYFENAKLKIGKPELYSGAPNVGDVGVPFSDSDLTQWGYSLMEYLLYHPITSSSSTNTSNQAYNDWTIQGGNDINYGVITYTLPANSKVIILGDFGTGQPDAVEMLNQILQEQQPDCILHLGDTYYAGMEIECQNYIVDVFQNAFQLYGKTIPVFSIPGNHEYMGGNEMEVNGVPTYIPVNNVNIPIPQGGGGGAFYSVILGLNDLAPLSATTTTIPAGCSQQASYFCLRTADNSWQFLGMDTGFYSVPTAGPTLGPQLHATEVAWLIDKLENFPGNTIMLSHHQLFSANAKINGATQTGTDYLNDYLLSYFRPYFNNNNKIISAWFWGHEHAYGIFQDGLYGLPKGRLIGSSGYEEEASWNPIQSNPYSLPVANGIVPYSSQMVVPDQTSVTWPDPWSFGDVPQLTLNWFNHVFSVLDFSSPTAPALSYYQFPVWTDGSSTPSAPVLNQISNTEILATTNPYFIGWNAGLNGEVSNANHVVVWNNLVFASANGTVFVLDNVTGAQLGCNALTGESGELRLLVVSDINTLFVCSANGNVYSLTLDSTVTWRWTKYVGYSVVTNLAYGNGYLYVGNHGDVLQLDPGTGILTSNKYNVTNLDLEVRLAFNGNYLYAGAVGVMYTLDPNDLSEISKGSVTPLINDVVSLIVTQNGNVFAGTYGFVNEYSADGNTLINSYNLGTGNCGEVRMTTDGTNVYAGSWGHVACLNLTTGCNSTSYVTALPGSDLYTVTLANSNGNLFVGCNGNLWKLDAASGTILLKMDVTADFNQIPVAINGDGVCAVFSTNIIVDGNYVNETYVTCVSQVNLT